MLCVLQLYRPCKIPLPYLSLRPATVLPFSLNKPADHRLPSWSLPYP